MTLEVPKTGTLFHVDFFAEKIAFHEKKINSGGNKRTDESASLKFDLTDPASK